MRSATPEFGAVPSPADRGQPPDDQKQREQLQIPFAQRTDRPVAGDERRRDRIEIGFILEFAEGDRDLVHVPPESRIVEVDHVQLSGIGDDEILGVQVGMQQGINPRFPGIGAQDF